MDEEIKESRLYAIEPPHEKTDSLEEEGYVFREFGFDIRALMSIDPKTILVRIEQSSFDPAYTEAIKSTFQSLNQGLNRLFYGVGALEPDTQEWRDTVARVYMLCKTCKRPDFQYFFYGDFSPSLYTLPENHQDILHRELGRLGMDPPTEWVHEARMTSYLEFAHV